MNDDDDDEGRVEESKKKKWVNLIDCHYYHPLLDRKWIMKGCSSFLIDGGFKQIQENIFDEVCNLMGLIVDTNRIVQIVTAPCRDASSCNFMSNISEPAYTEEVEESDQ